MAKCLSVLFGCYIFVSLVLHVGEIALNALFASQMLALGVSQTWLTITVGLMTLPMVTVQLVSAMLLLQRRSAQMTCGHTAVTIIMHILQLGFVWRHIRIMREDDPVWRKRDFADLCLLRLFYAFSASLPIFGIQVYMMIITSESLGWIILSASATTLMAIGWSLASFRRQYETNDIEGIALTCPGTLFRLIWRLGETVARLLALGVFASVYGSWIFVVIGLHWMTMLTCICTSVLGHLDVSGMDRCHKFIMNLLVSYIYVFCHINFNTENSQFRYITYYVIMFFENAVLLTVWVLTVEHNDSLKVHSILFIASLSFFVGIVSMTYITDVSIFHPQNWQLMDSLIDSMSEWEIESSSSDSTSEVGGREREQSQHFKKRPIVFKSSGTYSHRRFIEPDERQTNLSAGSESDTDGSSVISHHHLSSNSSSDDSDISLNNGVDNINSSKIHLLTESWDNLIDAVNDGYETDTSVHPLTAFRPISAQSLEDWYSDGYSTDHTSDASYQLPITVLAKNNRYSISVASDSTDCTLCNTLKDYRDRNVPQRTRHAKKSRVSKQEKIIEEREDKSFSEDKDFVETPRSTAWYNCGESSDSACPQEYVSSSNLETTFEEEEGVQESGMELII
ncbi:hypothetical protein FSP39_003059 [Pinctada imbricata]|uniref:XK-related protein n=1 Tax=Pinctada imbricata TaxID=66713 RepID=A0AA89BPN3_PINIB|nr:hypothetical protein FSP39_003059 [Pinctada imbricata]